MADKQVAISSTDFNCLLAIECASGHLRGKDSGEGELGTRCTRATLENLERLGLIKVVPELWLPLEIQTCKYRLTSAGRALMAARKAEKPQDGGRS
jgi:hypothetical protein